MVAAVESCLQSGVLVVTAIAVVVVTGVVVAVAAVVGEDHW